MMRGKAHRLVETQGPDERHMACCVLQTARHVGCGSPPTPRREAPGSGGETPPFAAASFSFQPSRCPELEVGRKEVGRKKVGRKSDRALAGAISAYCHPEQSEQR